MAAALGFPCVPVPQGKVGSQQAYVAVVPHDWLYLSATDIPQVPACLSVFASNLGVASFLMYTEKNNDDYFNLCQTLFYTV